MLSAAVILFWAAAAHAATITVEPWSPLFKGIDFATGRQQAVFTGERNHAVYSLRIDLTDPDVRFFGLPRCANWQVWGTNEVLSTTVSQFLVDYDLQVAVNCNFFWPNALAVGTPTDVLGLAISQGEILSPTNDPAHPSALLFATNNTPTFIRTNIPSTNLAGIYTAVSGNHPLVIDGVNVANPVIDVDPRTAFGISQEGRYLYAIIIDGRQTSYSDGATYYETADWLIRFGAYQGMNVDGGSCATMVKQDCAGASVRLNQNSYVNGTGHGQERAVGHMIGFYAKPALTFIHNVTVDPSDTTANILWSTLAEASTQVEYGLTTNYGSYLALSPAPVIRHVMTLTELTANTTYYFRAMSTAGSNTHTWACRFVTASFMNTNLIFDLTNRWTYTTNNLDRVNWQAPEYDDSGWLGSGPGLLCVETNASVAPRNTQLPPPHGQPIPPTYYFRTHFNFSGDPAGVGLLLSNYVDDGAVFYLNGAELYRLRMRPPPAVITYTSLASGYACSNAPSGCSGEACSTCPDVFTVPAGLVPDLHEGDNVLAVEVHNFSSGSLDIVFGSALYALRPYPPPLTLNFLRADRVIMLYWNGAGLTLQQADQLTPSPTWTDVPGPVAASPCAITNLDSTRFFRLRR